MAHSQSPDSNNSEQKIDEAIYQIADVTNKVLNVLSNSTDFEKSEFNNLDSEIQQAEKDQVERRKALEAENERKRQQLARKWKRY
ncbi:MAG: hypothetical protein HWQ38_00640 [Nostoc sp. NMS7]|uniref:hypothetical protein n=1 Tax=Nostoc sp. NMS7 TaxID=2815391 RepID=UPI0025E6E3FF|nr:hypothetical protein [Nostoc sp. NMS7]MBN3945067.1 hypothetical protein [Nostoc sp. NMS7]